MQIKKQKEKISKALESIKVFDDRMNKVKKDENLNKILPYYKLDWLLTYIVHGASPNDYILFKMYDKDSYEKGNLVTYRRHNKIDKKLNNYSLSMDIIGNKGLFNEFMKDHIKRNFIYSKDKTYDEIEKFFKDNKEVFYKQVKSTKGKGIKKLFFYKEEDKHFLKEAFDNQEEFVLEEIIKQHSLLQKINPYAVNSLRVNSILGKDGEVRILNVSLKISTDYSYIDNLSTGGFVYPVNLETGSIDKTGISYYDSMCPRIHPITKEEIVGIKIPFFEELKNEIRILSKKFPDFRYLGWDIAITEEGFDIIELNVSPGTKLLQADNKGKYNIIKSLI